MPVGQTPPVQSSAAEVQSAVVVDPVSLQFAFESTPWRDVIGWFADESGLALHIDELPPGSFTYSDASTFTINEALDRINLFLLPQGFTLIRGEGLLSVVNLGDPRSRRQLDALAPLVQSEQLDSMKSHDVVKCIFQLGELEPDDAIEEMSGLQLMTTPDVFEKTKRLMVVDTVEKLRSVKAILDAFQPDTMDNGTVVKSFVLKYATAEDVLVVARPHLGLATGEMIGIDVSVSADPSGKQIFVTGMEDKVKLIEGIIQEIDRGDEDADSDTPSQLTSHFVKGGNLRTVYDVLQTMLAGETVRLSIDEDASSIVALASVSNQEKIVATIEELAASQPEFTIIPLKHIDPYVAVSLLEEMLDLSERKRRAMAGMEAFTKHGNSRGLEIAKDPDETDYPKIDADPVNNRLFVRAKPYLLEQIKQIVEQLDESNGRSSGDTFRLLTINPTECDRILRTTARFWRGENPVVLYQNVVDDGVLGEGLAVAESIDVAIHPDAIADSSRGQFSRFSDRDDAPVTHEGSSEAHDEHAMMVSRQRAARDDSMFGQDARTAVLSGDPRSKASVIRCQMNRHGLILQSDDVEALDEFEQQLRMIAGPFESVPSPPMVFYLKYTQASDAIAMLAELLDGAVAASDAETSQLVNGATYVDGFFSSSILTSREGTRTMVADTITVVADARLNRLIAQGESQDLAQIQGYLEIIDKDRSISEIATHGVCRLIELVNVQASEVETVIRGVYAGRVVEKDSKGSSKPATAADAKRAAAEAKAARDREKEGGSGKSFDAKDSRSREPQMALAVHEPSNSLVVTAPEALFLEVERLAKQLDDRGKQSVEVLVPTGGPAMQDMLRQVLLGEEPDASSRSDSRRKSGR